MQKSFYVSNFTMKRTKNIKTSGDLHMEADCTIVVGLLSPPSGSKGHYTNAATRIILVCDCLTMHVVKKCKIVFFYISDINTSVTAKTKKPAHH